MWANISHSEPTRMYSMILSNRLWSMTSCDCCVTSQVIRKCEKSDCNGAELSPAVIDFTLPLHRHYFYLGLVLHSCLYNADDDA